MCSWPNRIVIDVANASGCHLIRGGLLIAFCAFHVLLFWGYCVRVSSPANCWRAVACPQCHIPLKNYVTGCSRMQDIHELI